MANNYAGRGLARGFFLICIGIVLVAIGLSLGGKLDLGGWPFGARATWEWGDGDKVEDVGEIARDLSSETAELVVELKAANLVVKTGSEAAVRATDVNVSTMTLEQDGDTFRVREKEWRNSIRFGKDAIRPRIEITLPDGAPLKRVKISVGAGSLELTGIDAERLEIETGAGSVRGARVSAREAEIETGAGSIDFADARLHDARIRTGAGKCALSGTLTGSSSIDTGAGKVELALNADRNDYRVEYARGIGSVRIGSEEFAGVGNGSVGAVDAPNRLSIQTGIGAVTVSFR